MSSADLSFDGILAPGLSLNVAGVDPNAGSVVIGQIDGTTVYEGGAGDSYTIKLAGTAPASGTVAYVTVSAAQSPAALLAQHARSIELSADNGATWSTILVLRFEVGAGGATDWNRTQDDPRPGRRRRRRGGPAHRHHQPLDLEHRAGVQRPDHRQRRRARSSTTTAPT